MIKAFLRRHRLLALPLLIVIGSLMLPWGRLSAETDTSVPAKVIAKEAIVIDQGVQISWLAAQPGTHSIGGYVIEKNQDGGFKPLARVEKVSLSYIDSDGMIGDTYRIIAEDIQQPPKHSPASDQLTATLKKPGSTFLITTAYGSTGAGNTTPEALQSLLVQAFTELDKALIHRAPIEKYLNALQSYQKQVLGLFPQLPASQKTILAKTCADQMPMFEAAMHTMPEHNRMDGLLVHAGCDAIQDAAR